MVVGWAKDALWEREKNDLLGILCDCNIEYQRTRNFYAKNQLKNECSCFWVSNETVLLVMETDGGLDWIKFESYRVN